MTDSLFDNNQNEDNIQIDENKDYLSEYVGEGKKFKTPQDLAKSKYHADTTIELYKKRMDQLREENENLRTENMAKARLEALIDQVDKKVQTTQPAQSDGTHTLQTQKPASTDPNEIKSLFSSFIQEHETTRKEEANFNLVMNRLTERFGANYQSVLEDQIQSLGLTKDFVNDLARKHPEVLFKTLGVDQPRSQSSYQAPPRSTNMTAFTPKGPSKRTWSYYQELKKTNPNMYYDRKIANQMHDDMIALGDEFKDGDFNAGEKYF